MSQHFKIGDIILSGGAWRPSIIGDPPMSINTNMTDPTITQCLALVVNIRDSVRVQINAKTLLAVHSRTYENCHNEQICDKCKIPFERNLVDLHWFDGTVSTVLTRTCHPPEMELQIIASLPGEK